MANHLHEKSDGKLKRDSGYSGGTRFGFRGSKYLPCNYLCRDGFNAVFLEISGCDDRMRYPLS